MNNSLPADLAKLQSRFEHWRNTRSTRSPIPQDLLQAARDLLGRYSISAVCHACRLHPSSLRKSAQTRPVHAPPAKVTRQPSTITPPAFYSLPATVSLAEPGSPITTDCRLVLERPDGARLTLTVPQLDVVSLSTLCSDFLRA